MLRLSAWASQTVNVWLLLGHHDQTVSARCYINRYRKGWKLAYKAINALFFWQENHCKASFEQDIAYALEVLSISNAQ
jgi:hypothetical protein